MTEPPIGTGGRIEAQLRIELIRRVKISAAETDQSRSLVVQEALEDYLTGENARLLAVIQKAATAWLSLEPGVSWEGGIGEAMEAAVAEIDRLRHELSICTRESLSALLEIER